MKKNILFLLFLFPIVSIHANDEDDQLGKAVNKAGFQRMLTQRLAKSYLAVLTKTNMHSHLNQIEIDVKTFEKNYQEIKSLSTASVKVLSEIKVAEKEWQAYKALVTQTPNLEDASLILDMNTKLLGKCHQVVMSLERQAQQMGSDQYLQKSYNELAYLTNISGRQRMLSQRIMLYYLANRLNIKTKNSDNELSKSINLYSQSLEELMGSLENTPEIDVKLLRLVNDWKKMEVLCKNMDELSDEEVTEMLTTSDLLLSEMDMVTKLYEDLIDTHIASLMLGNAVNKAGKQRMLTQKMAKSYFAIMLGIEPNKYQKELKLAQEDFQKNLSHLERYAPMEEIKDAIEQVDYLWKDYQVLIDDFTNKEVNAKKVLDQNTQLLKACHNVVLMLKVYSKSMTGSVRFDNELVNLIDKSGRQRMLSQRMVLYCMASSWNQKDATVDRYLGETVDQYGKALEELSESNKNTSEIKARLVGVRSNWETIEGLCSESDGNTTRVLELSNQLLKDMDEVTGMYEQIIGQLMDSEAINKAARQRMLTQRIAADALGINMGIDVLLREQQLKKNVTLFSHQLDELKIYAGDGAAKGSINRVVTLWKRYKNYAVGEFSDDNVGKLIELNSEILEACEVVVADLIEANSLQDKTYIRLINMAGLERMLSQRINLHALALRKGINPDLCKKELEVAIGEYKKILEKLQRSSANTPDTYSILETMKRMIDRVDGYVSKMEERDLYQILATNNILLAESESLTKAYEDLSKKERRMMAQN